MKTKKVKVSGKPFSSRTVIGIVCIVLAFAITFGVAPLVNRFTDRKVDIVKKLLQHSGMIIDKRSYKMIFYFLMRRKNSILMIKVVLINWNLFLLL